jgi:hypothetical protein
VSYPRPEAGLGLCFQRPSGQANPGTNAVFADGSIRFLPGSIKPYTLRALPTYAGAETISSDDL